MKGSPCCAGLMRSCLHTYRTKTNLTQHIIQPLGGGGGISQVWGGSSTNYRGVIHQVWGGHQPTMRGVISQVWGGGHQPTMGGSSAKYGGGSSTNYGGGGIFPPVCTGSQNRENNFSNTYVLPHTFCKQNGRTNKEPHKDSC